MSYPELLQERYREDPWKMLVCCMLLNQTTRRQVDGVLDELFERWPDSVAMAHADPKELENVLRPLGLWRVRVGRIRNFSRQWHDYVVTRDELPPWPILVTMPGVGSYAVDSYRLFVLGEEFELMSGDKELVAYKRRERERQSDLEQRLGINR